MTRSIANGRVYDGCKVLHPDGQLMFRCDKKRANWYLDRDLAVLVDSDPMTIQLTFPPKGPGHIGDKFYLQDRENACAVCGAVEGLSRHHVVPHCYVRSSSDPLFDHNSHDVVPMCVTCHDKYERKHSHCLRQKLAEYYDAPLQGKGYVDPPLRRAISAALALKSHSSTMPEDRIKELHEMIAHDLGHMPSKTELEELSQLKPAIKSDNFQTHGELVMSKVTDLNEFVCTWRKHFLETMKPKHLPEHWSADRKLGRIG